MATRMTKKTSHSETEEHPATSAGTDDRVETTDDDRNDRPTVPPIKVDPALRNAIVGAPGKPLRRRSRA